MDKEYLKMADVFAGSVSPKHIDDGCATEIASGDCAVNYYVLQDDEYWMLIDKEQAEYAAHAINSHDELVADIERLRGELSAAEGVLSEVYRVVTERIKNGAYDLDDIADEVLYAIDRINVYVD